ncbi:MAG: glycosyltransferase family 4 protein [Cyclobacteriaceae bacterium]
MKSQIKQRIAFFGVKYYPSKGGTSRVAEDIAKELRHNYDFTVYCYGDDKAQSHLQNVKVVTFPSMPFGPAGVFLYYFICCLHLLFSKRYDLIHAHKIDCAFFIPLLSLRSKIVATSHGAPYKTSKWNFIGRTYFRLMERFFIYAPACLTTVSKPLSEYYQDKYQRSVHYLPNGVAINYELNDENAEDILTQHGIGSEEKFIFFAARRIMSIKGCHTMIKALKKINYKGAIIMAGETTHSPTYINYIQKLAKGLDLKFIGYVEEKPTLLALVAKAHLFVFPSEIEGLSIMLLEVAIIGRTPLICSDIPANLPVFSKEEVLYFRNKDADDLANKFIWAEDNWQEMSRNVDKARTKVLEEYSSQVMASNYSKLYNKLLYK